MTSQELKQIVEQRATDPAVIGRLACNLRSDQAEQKNADDRQFQVHWQEQGDFWRCTVTPVSGSGYLARVDVHDNSSVRVEAREPCSVTISKEDDLLCLTRFR